MNLSLKSPEISWLVLFLWALRVVAWAVPSVPTGLAASTLTASTFTLSWTASTGSPTGYKVFKKECRLAQVVPLPNPA